MSASDQLRNLHERLWPAPWEPSSRGLGAAHVLGDGGAIAVCQEAGDDAEPISLLRNVLPLIADAIAAAEESVDSGCRWWPATRAAAEQGCKCDHCNLRLALAALDDALKDTRE